MIRFSQGYLRPALNLCWPYFIFTILVAIYNCLFLRYGFNATDEGWLLTLGKRISEGQIPYKDFYFLINPLSIYIQAFFIWMLGDSHTILISRICWVVQMWLISILLSFVYRKYVNRIELLLLLIMSFFVSTMLISFPWYNYDAAFFAVLTLLFFGRRKYVLMGCAAFFSFLSKQSYILLLPLFFFGNLTLQYFNIIPRIIKINSSIKISIGWLIPMFVYIGYLTINNSLSAYYYNVVSMPIESNQVSLTFAIFQNNAIAFLIGLPLIFTVMVLILAPSKNWLCCIILSCPAFLFIFMQKFSWFGFSVIMFNYAVFLFSIFKFNVKKCTKIPEYINSILPSFLLLIIIQYLSGMTLVGVFFGTLGAGLALPFSYIYLKNLVHIPSGRYFILPIFLVILVFAVYYKTSSVYRDDDRSNLTAEFKSGKLRGIKTTPRNFKQIESVIASVEKYSNPGDYIMIYPDFPVLYYLTDRRNPSPVDWYYWRGLNNIILDRAMNALRQNPPKAVYMQAYSEEDYSRTSNILPYNTNSPYRPMFLFIKDRYTAVEEVGDIFVFLPK